MPQPDDLAHLLAEVRDLTNQYRSGQPEAFQAFASLVSRLLNLTVLAPSGGLKLHYETPTSYVLAGRTLHDPLPLNDGNFLRTHMSLYIEQTPEGPRLKVKKATGVSAGLAW